MANQYSQSPIILEAPFAGSYKALAALGGPWTIRIGKILWESPSNVGHVALLTDPQTGRERLRLTCEVALQSQLVDLNGEIWSDFSCPELDSGRLLIRLR